MWTKAQLISEAYAELALQGYEFDIQPDEDQTALRRLDTMMATWEGKGIRLGYAFPATPEDSEISAPSGLPDSANEAVYMNLAVRLAPGNGKQLSADTRRVARETYAELLADVARPARQQLPSTLPTGAGNRCWPTGTRGRNFFPPPCKDPLPVDCAGDMTIPPE